jgi:hypothetical protein
MKSHIKGIILVVATIAAQTAFAQTETTEIFSGVKTIWLSTSSGSCKINRSSDDKVKVVNRHSFEKDFYKPFSARRAIDLK